MCKCDECYDNSKNASFNTEPKLNKIHQTGTKGPMKHRQLMAFLGAIISLALAACQAPHGAAPESGNVKFFGLPTDCQKNVPQLDTGDQSTLMYHWTDHPLAATDPSAYVNGTITAGFEMNKRELGVGRAGNGFYLASDPFSTASYGHILLTVAIKSRQQVANWPDELHSNPKMSLRDVITGHGCTEIAYSYLSIYEPSRALVLTSSRLVDNSRKMESWNLPAPAGSPAEMSAAPATFVAHPSAVAKDATLKEYLIKYRSTGLFRVQKKFSRVVPSDLYVAWAQNQARLNGIPPDSSAYGAIKKSLSLNQGMQVDIHSMVELFWGGRRSNTHAGPKKLFQNARPRFELRFNDRRGMGEG